MRKSKLIKFNGVELTVKELTVSQITEVLDGLVDYEPHILDVIMDMPVPATAFFLSIGMAANDFDGSVAPSELDPVYEAVLEVNPTLAETMVRMKQAGNRVLKSEGSPAS